jgi:valyl-tRNA synthetase
MSQAQTAPEAPETQPSEGTRYTPASVEARWAEAWEAAGCFTPRPDACPAKLSERSRGAQPFAIMMPPPNVTGTLHLGHALDNTLPDILVRRARMQGKAALYQPGTDHASIAVHVVLERKWAKEAPDGKTSRFDMGREKFMEEAWKWKDHSHGLITSQIRKLGISCDWANERFTMDAGYVKAVNTAFMQLYEKGLIYRGQRLVNWDPKMQTAVSDLEVKHKEVKGNLWHVRYLFADGKDYNGESGIEIATTRPETILADGAIAIHPSDERAKDLIGRKVLVPMVNRAIPIVADEMVDPTFGSGMVKITAAHDFNDFAFYNRHKGNIEIPLINLLNPDGTMNSNCPAAYVGMDRFAARKQIVADLEALGQLIKVEPHTHNIGHAERDDTVLEPYLTWQWYIKGEPLAKLCLEVAKKGEITFINARDEKVFRHWLENIEDWCISRQLWWGHRIPAWFKGTEGTPECVIKVQEDCPGPEHGTGWRQDNDILDTWFSSGLWPFATQGWPQEGGRQVPFFPGAAIMSGRDILFFWLVRMLMMSLAIKGTVPFKTIYTHGLILDEKGQKMSKSKGNVIDPLIMMEKYGTDALRLTMASIASAEDMRFSEAKVEQNRNFCTKLWNAARFLAMNGARYDESVSKHFEATHVKHPVNQWLVMELADLFRTLDSHLDAYAFNQAAQAVYHFAWGTFCDWYVELCKPLLAQGGEIAEETKACMGWAFTQMLGALHPFIPFITEELWQQHTAAPQGHFLMLQRWPDVAQWPTFTEGHMQTGQLVAVLSAMRQARAQHKLPPKAKLNVGLRNATPELEKLLQTNAGVLSAMVGIAALTPRNNAAEKGEAMVPAAGAELIISLEGLVDFSAERVRLQKEHEKLSAELAKTEGLLANQGFVARAPAEVLAEHNARAAEFKTTMAAIGALLEGPYRA